MRRRAASRVLEAVFYTASTLGKTHPGRRLAAVERISDLAYETGGGYERTLDVYRPRDRSGVLPAVVYIHGGAFRVLSKDSHWLMGTQFASAGCVCFNINYRLAPANPYPAALEDVARALQWIVEHAALYDADPEQLVVAGESAGANLSLAYTAGACLPSQEPIADRIKSLGIVPKVIMPNCGILEATRPERFENDPRVRSWWVMDRIRTVSKSYTPGWKSGDPAVGLADPLVMMESDLEFEREWPATFIGCGDADPIADDSERLARALEQRGVDVALRWYAEQPHAFQMMVWRDEAKAFWKDSFDFLKARLEHEVGYGAVA
ncbi:MAG: alpha/beta hydrolase [Myxococcota bacterium]